MLGIITDKEPSNELSLRTSFVAIASIIIREMWFRTKYHVTVHNNTVHRYSDYHSAARKTGIRRMVKMSVWHNQHLCALSAFSCLKIHNFLNMVMYFHLRLFLVVYYLYTTGSSLTRTVRLQNAWNISVNSSGRQYRDDHFLGSPEKVQTNQQLSV